MPESCSIVILEDNTADAELIHFELKEAGLIFTSKVVANEKEYIQAIQDDYPDIILADYDLPTYNGALALAEARRRCPDTPFILVSGAIVEDRAIEILTQGAKDYVLKNRLQQRLAPAVTRALAEAEELRARKHAEAELHQAYKTMEDKVKVRTAELEAEIVVRTKMAEALQESERREHKRAEELGTILDAVPTPVIIVHDRDATHMTGNRTANELLNQPQGAEISLSAPNEVKPRHFRAMKDGRELRLDELPAQRAARGEHVQNFEFSLAFNDGTTRHVLGYGTPLLNEQGQPRGAVHVLVDITERKQAETKLHRYELLADRHRDIILFIGIGDGRILEANKAATRAYGYHYEQLLTMTIHDLLAADACGLTSDRVATAYKQGLLFETVHRCQDGSTFPVEVSSHGADIDGRHILISVIRDITRRKQMEREIGERTALLEERTRQMEAANKELESFSYSVSHDLRAPLRAIDGYTRMILRKHDDNFDEETRSKLNVIRDNALRMGQLIEELLAFSRMGSVPLSMSRIGLEELCKDVWEELKAISPHRRMTLKITSLPPCKGDRGLIRQVFANLLANAVKFTKTREEALIEVGGEIKGSEGLYYIQDNGVGFDMQYHDKMFGVFQRLHSADEFEGTGVGLALVERIVSRHNGKIWAEGEVDKGATFYFTLSTRR